MRTKEQNKKILVIGSISMDLVVTTPLFPRSGETVFGSNFHQSPGGKGANQAVAVARLGGSVAIVGKVGCDEFGNSLLETLSEEGVDTSHVLQDESTPTGIAFINLDGDGNNRIAVVLGANLKYTSKELLQLEDLIKAHDIMMLQLEVDPSLVDTALELAAKNNVPVILDPAPVRPLNIGQLQKVTYLTPNETEFENLTGISLGGVVDARNHIHILLDKGVQNVILTLGSEGVLVADQSGRIKHLPSHPVKVVDTVAAGDSFNGALAIGLVNGLLLDEAVAFANAVAALTVSKEGAIPSLPRLHEAEEFLKSNLEDLAL